MPLATLFQFDRDARLAVTRRFYPSTTIFTRSPGCGWALTSRSFMIASVAALTKPLLCRAAIDCHESPWRTT